SKLKREVAIKVLPEEFARDADRVGRFQREAEVLATLNHPNIAAIYDVQEVDSTRLLVLELVEGETLAERIQRGPIPVEEALQIAGHIGEALEAAHEKGIVHRDLKPANIKITPEGKVKVLDFGLAKALEGSTAAVALSNSPTLVNTFAATNAGLIIGTAAYMSPEQTRGISVDHRTDIWAFGCVLYEMLTARQAFTGELVSDVLASVLARDVDYTVLHPQLHPRLTNAISRCLEKDRKRRWQAMGDVRVEIQDVVGDPFGSKLLAPRALDWPLWKRAVTVAVTAIVVAASTLAITSSFRTSPPANVVRFSFAIPEGQRFNRGGGRHVIAISPAGGDITYVADNQLFVRKLSEMDSRRIQGTDDPGTPFFSPDGQWLAFYSVSESKLKKVAISGGAPVTIAETPSPIGASWSVNDQIFIGATSGGVLRVRANGGKPETVIKIEADEEAQSPQLLSDGENVLFTLTKAAVDRSPQIAIQSLKTGRRQVLFDGGSDARYVPTGHILYGVASNVLSVPFDIKSLRLTGGPVPVLEGVAHSPTRALMPMGVSNQGKMIYGADGGFGSGGRVFVLTDSMGQTKALPFAGGLYFHPRISPNGKQLVISSDDGKDASVWLYDLDGSTSLRRLTF